MVPPMDKQIQVNTSVLVCKIGLINTSLQVPFLSIFNTWHWLSHQTVPKNKSWICWIAQSLDRAKCIKIAAKTNIALQKEWS